MFPHNIKTVGRDNFRRYVGAQQTKNAFVSSKEQVHVIRIWTVLITWRTQASN